MPRSARTNATITAMAMATITTTTIPIITMSTVTKAPMSPVVIELQAPDIAPYRESNTGTPYVHRFDSGKSGPDVLVVALTHGNEVCAAVALRRLLTGDVRPLRGKPTLALAHRPA